MRKLPLLLLALALVSGAAADDSETQKAAAFYQGESLNYIMVPPPFFSMSEREARLDGYSFAFIPEEQTYDTANVLIGVNIYKTRNLKFDKVLENDTTSIRKHFGKDIEIWAVDSVYAATGQQASAFYLNAKDRILPNVMIAYFNGGTELVIFELVITETALRFAAEDKFVQCINAFKMQPRRAIGQR